MGFFNFVVMPLFRAFTTRFHACKPLLDAARVNQQYWTIQETADQESHNTPGSADTPPRPTHEPRPKPRKLNSVLERRKSSVIGPMLSSSVDGELNPHSGPIQAVGSMKELRVPHSPVALTSPRTDNEGTGSVSARNSPSKTGPRRRASWLSQGEPN